MGRKSRSIARWIDVDAGTSLAARLAVRERNQMITLDGARVDRQIRQLALEHAGDSVSDDGYLARLRSLG